MTNEERDALIERARKTPWLDEEKRRETEALLGALAEARSQLAALHAAVAREVRGMVCGHVKCGCTKHTLMRILADLAAAAREHEQSIRADERAKALREAAVSLHADADNIAKRCEVEENTILAYTGKDMRTTRMHAVREDAERLRTMADLADEAERGTR